MIPVDTGGGSIQADWGATGQFDGGNTDLGSVTFGNYNPPAKANPKGAAEKALPWGALAGVLILGVLWIAKTKG